MGSMDRGCSAELGSMTYALKAQKVLAGAVIPCSVIKFEASASRRGCVYGIRFSCEQAKNVQRILASAHIAVKRWNTGI